jgi:hypothetical protein
MKLLVAAIAVAFLAGMPVHAANLAPSAVISAPHVIFDDDDGYSQPSGDDGDEAVNPCAPATYDPNECITPE